ncbi:MAG: phosphohydrolase [Candidatus Staskawiczbacteria bacterium]|jgi:hypothetical protein
MITLSQVKQNKHVLEFIGQTEKTLSALSFTDHGLRHANITAERATRIAKDIGLDARAQELAGIASFCHDMGNFISRSHHNYFTSILFYQLFNKDFDSDELGVLMQAIANHDKSQEDMSFANPISAIVVLADKSDVHRSRVITKKIEDIKTDIHDRVNYATTECQLKVDKTKKRITLTLKIDTNFVPIMEYFEIFTDRMVFCRLAAEYLGHSFGLVINNFRLL